MIILRNNRVAWIQIIRLHRVAAGSVELVRSFHHSVCKLIINLGRPQFLPFTWQALTCQISVTSYSRSWGSPGRWWGRWGRSWISLRAAAGRNAGSIICPSQQSGAGAGRQGSAPLLTNISNKLSRSALLGHFQHFVLKSGDNSYCLTLKININFEDH